MTRKLSVLALAALFSTASAHAAIDNGAGGNGELFFSLWDANGSYSRDLNLSINDFEAALAATGALDLVWNADATLGSYLAGVTDLSALSFNLMATDTSGARRLLATYTPPTVSPTKTNDVIRSAATAAQTFVNNVNNELGANESVMVNSASAAWAGKSAFNNNLGGLLNFSDAGSLANNDYANGLGFLRIDAAATGIANSKYLPYVNEDGSAVNVWFDANRALHIASLTAPVPEADTWAMLAAGLGLVGLAVRRRRV